MGLQNPAWELIIKMEKINWVTPPFPGGVRFRWQGVMDFGELYRFMKWWLEDNEFCNDNGFTADKKCMEKKYVERRFAGGLRNVEIEWKTYRDRGDYFRYNLWVTFLILGMTDEEGEVKGVKRKLNKGDFDIRMGANVETGYGEGWSKSVLKKIYFRFFIQKRLEMHKRYLYILFYRFNNAVKEYVQKQRY